MLVLTRLLFLLSQDFVKLHTYMYIKVHEALTLLIHDIIGDFLKVDACSMDTILMNDLEKMHGAAIVACR